MHESFLSCLLESFLSLLSIDCIYSKVIVISALDGFKFFYGLIGFVVDKSGIILVKDLALMEEILQQEK